MLIIEDEVGAIPLVHKPYSSAELAAAITQAWRHLDVR